MLTHDIDIGIMSICPSVTLRCCVETASLIIILSSAYSSRVILIFLVRY